METRGSRGADPMSVGAEPEDAPIPGLTDRYAIGDLLGCGGTAEVYRATERGSGRPVAIKIVSSARPGSAALDGHRSEAAALRALHHPGVVEVYETGHHAGGAYLIMQLVDGESLSQRILRAPLSVREAMTMGARVSDTLAHVHDQCIVHRDVKPANVLLDAGQRPFLTDFGISRLIDATQVTATGISVGTPAFMAPEQVRGQAVGPAADVYALALVLLEAMTGQREYPGGVVESAVARLHRRPDVPAWLPAPLSALLIAMTADSPTNRPTAREVAARLTALATDAGGTATTDLTPRPRTPMLVAAATIVALIAVGLGLVGTATPTPPAATAGSVPPAAGLVPDTSSPTLPAPAAPSPIPVAARPAPAPSVPGNGASPPRWTPGRSGTVVRRTDSGSDDPEDSSGPGDKKNKDKEKGNGKEKSNGDGNSDEAD